MPNTFPPEAQQIMNERFHCDTLIALATAEDAMPSVRAVNAFYEERAFYVITDARSGKMRQIRQNPSVAVCGDWFTGHGTGEDLGPILAGENREIAAKLRAAFASWYANGHTDESNPNTHILRVRLTRGVLFSHGTRYDIDFSAG